MKFREENMNNKNKHYIKVLLVVLVFVAAGVIFSCSIRQKAKDAEENAVVIEDQQEPESEDAEETTAELICVHVCGSVNAPGVYYLAKGARIHEAVELAGGMTGDADLQYVNLAEEAADGEQIYIPSTQEVEEGIVPAAGSGGLSDDGLVNINTAGLDELKTLPGIGDIKAEAIISYRENTGEFASIEEIMNVAGIKESSYEKIKEHIKV